jgi:hypothetical protein
MKTVFNNAQVAHVWASGSQERGDSHNRNSYFRGRILYSYGNHFPVGVLMGVGQVVLNSDTYSISTTGMQSDARHATSHMTRVRVPDLKAVADTLSTLAYYVQNPPENPSRREARDRNVKALIGYIEANAAALQDDIGGPYVSGHWDTPDGRHADGATYVEGYSTPAGKTEAEALLEMCGVPTSRAATAIRRGLATAAKNATAQAVADRKREKGEAIQVADMTPNELDSYLEKRWHVRPFGGTPYNDSSSADALGRASKALFGMIKVAKAEKLSASRLGRLKAHRAVVRAVLTAYNDDQAGLVAQEHARRFENWKARYTAAKDDEARLAVWRSNGVHESAYDVESDERAALRAANLEGRQLDSAERMAREVDAREAWLKGEGSRHVRLNGPDGTALVRRSNDGERLETSHGADVPWDHAVKAFRFIRLCVERGEAFHTNGRTVRVGPFKVDSIAANGDMKAGCHSFAWEVMRELAEREGVLTLTPSAEALEVTA